MVHVFLLCSGLAACVNLLVGYLLYGVMGLDGKAGYAMSVALAFMAGMMVSFLLNRKYTYAPSGRETYQDLGDFLAVSLVGLLLTTCIAMVLKLAMQGGVFAGLPAETTAHICAVGITAGYSFVAHKYISFRPKGTSWPPDPAQQTHGLTPDNGVTK